MFWYDIAVSAAAAIISLYVFCASDRFPQASGGGMGPGYWPSFLGAILLILAVLLFAESLWKRRRRSAAADTEPETVPFDFASPGMRCVYCLCGVFLVFGLLLRMFNFMAGAVFLIPACMLLLGEKRIPILAAVTIGVPLAVHVIFAWMLGVELP